MSSQIARQIGANLRLARKSRNLTQTELGDLIGCDGFQISRWERGAHRPGDDALLALAMALDLDYFDFFQPPEKEAA